VIESFKNSIYALWYADLVNSEVGDAVIEKLIETAQQEPDSMMLKANCQNLYAAHINDRVAIMLATWGISTNDSGGILAEAPNTEPTYYVKRDTVAYVTREYQQWKPNCEDCDNEALSQIHKGMRDRIEMCLLANTGVFRCTNYT